MPSLKLLESDGDGDRNCSGSTVGMWCVVVVSRSAVWEEGERWWRG